jgi:hypothetical protein
VAAPPPEAAVGTLLRKRFPRGWYAGTVASYDATWRLYRISYDDGDGEEMDAADLHAALRDMANERSGARQGTIALRSRKRGQQEGGAAAAKRARVEA